MRAVADCRVPVGDEDGVGIAASSLRLCDGNISYDDDDVPSEFS